MRDTFYLLRVHPSVVVDDVPVSAYFKHCLEFSVDDDVCRLLEWLISTRRLFLVLTHQIKMRSVARIGSQVESKEDVSSSKLLSNYVVSVILKHLTNSRKHITVTSHQVTITETRLWRFRRNLLSYVRWEQFPVVVFYWLLS